MYSYLISCYGYGVVLVVSLNWPSNICEIGEHFGSEFGVGDGIMLVEMQKVKNKMIRSLTTLAIVEARKLLCV